MKKTEIFAALEQIAQHRILILDGAMGTMIQKKRLSEADFRGKLFTDHPVALKGNNDVLCLTQPELILDIHRAYLAAGADIIETNTFNSTAVSQADYRLEAWAERIAEAGARLARQACDEVMTREPGRRCFAAGSIGPTAVSLSIAPDAQDPSKRALTFDQLAAAYETCVQGLVNGGVDILLIETVYDTLNAKAAVWAINQVFSTLGHKLPLMISGTIADASGRILSGQTARAFLHSIRHVKPFSVGFNCSMGAESLLPFVDEIAVEADCAISLHPNAGMPNELGEYDDSPHNMAQVLAEFARSSERPGKHGANIIGGCCGTTPEHIRAIAEAVRGIKPRRFSRHHGSSDDSAKSSHLQFDLEHKPVQVLAGLEPLEISAETLFVNIGERTNVAGSRAFARVIREGKLDEALAVARSQIEAGAQIIDVNLDDPLIDAVDMMGKFLNLIAAEPDIARVPMMIDSSRWDVLLEGLKHLQGKGIINSISLKDGETAFLERAGIARALGAAVLVMAMDERGQAETFERKIEVCKRSYRLLVEKAGLPPQDIILDPNIFAIGTGIEEHRSHAVDYIKAVAWIKANLPGALVSGGVSNLSFAFRGNEGLRAAMHAVFLYHARTAGMDMGIVNPAQLVVYEEIPANLRERLEDLVLNRRPDATERLIEVASLYSGIESGGAETDQTLLSAEERVIHALVSGTFKTLTEDIEALRTHYPRALSVIEGPLMKGMNTVGMLFGQGKMFLPQVVKSARIMKEAVRVLEPYIEAEKKSTEKAGGRGRILLATVKGDVHDIGKNIVSLILSCNGYEVIDLGVMVSSEHIVQSALAHNADAVGLSGLISPSLEEMARVAELMELHKMKIPLLIGGATTNPLHTALKIAPLYSGPVIHIQDASRAPGVVEILFSPDRCTDFYSHIQREQEKMRIRYAKAQEKKELVSIEEARRLNEARRVLKMSSLYTRVPLIIPVKPGPETLRFGVLELVPDIDWTIFLHCWGLSGTYPDILEDPVKGAEAQRLLADARYMLARAADTNCLTVTCRYGIFPAGRSGDDILIYSDTSRTQKPARLVCLRQQRRNTEATYVSLADFIRAVDDPEPDWIGAFAINAGASLDHSETRTMLGIEQNPYLNFLAESLVNALAEAASSRLFTLVREELWGFGVTGAAGIRPAPGYPSCPDHRDKALIFSLLHAETELSLHLTESFMMTPSSAVCGWYFASPEAQYFSVGRIGRDQLSDYAQRRGESMEEAAQWLMGNLDD